MASPAPTPLRSDAGSERAEAAPERAAILRSLPSVEDLLRSADAEPWLACLPRPRVTDMVRDALGGIRADVLAGRRQSADGVAEDINDRVGAAIDLLLRGTLRPVINASGVILHTNLGRAPLGAAAIQAIVETAGRYSNLEYEVATGRRGNRDAHCGSLLETLLGAPSIVVNNNAAAIFLVLNELARDGEVIVSRGELIEIGDGFRIPEILEASRATLREVGTTNRTGLEDYRRAINSRTRALVRIHPSNFRQIGFTGRPALADLAALSRSESVPLVEDLGSGCLARLEGTGADGEPTVAESLSTGVDVVTFSGDKLLGGPQAGIIAGRAELVQRIRRNPLFRALRVDKLTLAALSSTLRSHLAGRHDDIPALRLARAARGRLAARARRFVRRLEMLHVPVASVVEGQSLLGGGSTPMLTLESVLVAIRPPEGMTVGSVEASLRAHDPPVVARIEKGRLLLDLRTVFETEEDDLLAAVHAATGAGQG